MNTVKEAGKRNLLHVLFVELDYIIAYLTCDEFNIVQQNIFPAYFAPLAFSLIAHLLIII